MEWLLYPLTDMKWVRFMYQYYQFKARVHTILDEPQRGDRTALLVQSILAMAIVVNTLAIILFTVQSIDLEYHLLFSPLIGICFTIFTIEYTLRIWSCTSSQDFRGMITDRVRYALHFYQIIDLISIIPFLFPFFFPRHLTLLRTLRILSIFKLGRYSRFSQSLNLLKRVLFSKREIFVIMLFILIFLVLFSSTIVYLIEKPVQPDKFSSIPAAMWWSMMTITTVGYGDIIPITPLGKIIGSIMTFTGVLVLALPPAILATGFIEERDKGPEQKQRSSALNDPTELLIISRKLHEEGKISSEEFNEISRIAMRLIEG